MIKTCRRVLLGGMNKNEDLQMYLPVMLTIMLNFSATMVEYSGLGKIFRKILET